MKNENILRHLSASFIKILAYGVDQIVYISCKVTSLVRDLPAFYEAGYEMTHACAVDQFCQGVHVETVVLLSR